MIELFYCKRDCSRKEYILLHVVAVRCAVQRTATKPANQGNRFLHREPPCLKIFSFLTGDFKLLKIGSEP
jgi:hypothetical protein